MRRLFWQEEEFYAKEIAKAFNASQVDIQVNLHILDKESYDSEITERIRAGEKVDVFDIRGISTLCDYQSQELLLDLTCQSYTRSEICRLRCVELSTVKTQIRNILKKLEFCYQKAGLVKYDAYNQMGGNLSFCLCMLNERNSGFILNSVHSSDGCYTYTKEIKNGECEIALGEEERKALNMAIGF